MTPKPALTGRARTVGYVSHADQVRIDERVKEILARRVTLDRARRAAQRLNRTEQEQCRTSSSSRTPPTEATPQSS
jgi:hypothetical protein